MSFFDKIKQAVGVGVVSVEIRVAAPVEARAGKIQGQVILTSEQPQTIRGITVELTEKYSSGRGEDRTTKKSVLGNVRMDKTFALAAGKPAAVTFVLAYKMGRFSGYTVSQPRDMLGSMGKLLTRINDDKVEHVLHAAVEVQGSALHAQAHQPVEFV